MPTCSWIYSTVALGNPLSISCADPELLSRPRQFYFSPCSCPRYTRNNAETRSSSTRLVSASLFGPVIYNRARYLEDVCVSGANLKGFATQFVDAELSKREKNVCQWRFREGRGVLWHIMPPSKQNCYTKWIDIWEARVFSKRNFEEGAKIRCINLIRSNVCLGHGVFIEYKLSILKSISSLG